MEDVDRGGDCNCGFWCLSFVTCKKLVKVSATRLDAMDALIGVSENPWQAGSPSLVGSMIAGRSKARHSQRYQSSKFAGERHDSMAL